jgi:hypothetical protein
MIDTLHKVLTDSAMRDSKAVEASLAENSDQAIAWFD